MYHILLATDGSENSKRVVEEVLTIPDAIRAEGTILNVVEQQWSNPLLLEKIL